MKKNIIERYDYLDLLKCIAMIMVVSLHTSVWQTNFIDNNSINFFIQYCIRIICEGVPIFVLINGFLLINKELDIKKHIKKMIKIILLIIIWTTIPFIVINIINNNSFTLNELINNTLTVDISNRYNGPIWFLQNLLMLYFIYPIINYLFKNDKKIYYYTFYVVIFFTFIASFLSSIDNLFSFKYINNIIIFINNINPIKNGIFLFYFMLGGVLFDKKELINDRKIRIITILIGMLVYIFSIIFTVYIFKCNHISFSDNYLYGRILLVFIIIGLFMLVYNYRNSDKIYNKIIKSIGSNTLGIFLIHVPLKIILYNYNIINLSNLFNRIIFCAIVFNLSYIITLVLKRIPYINKLITI